MAPPVFKTGLAANIVAGGFDSLPPPPPQAAWSRGNAALERLSRTETSAPRDFRIAGRFISRLCRHRIQRTMPDVRAPAQGGATTGVDSPRRREPPMQHRNLFRTFSALVLPFVIQACIASGPQVSTIGGGSPPPMSSPFDAYDICIRNLPGVPVWEWFKFEDERRACFRQTIQVNHLTLPAGTTADQAFANYDACIKKNGHFGSNTPYAVRENCFTSAVQ